MVLIVGIADGSNNFPLFVASLHLSFSVTHLAHRDISGLSLSTIQLVDLTGVFRMMHFSLSSLSLLRKGVFVWKGKKRLRMGSGGSTEKAAIQHATLSRLYAVTNLRERMLWGDRQREVGVSLFL